MFSKKNKKQYDLKHADGRQHWSLRKTTLGMASVLLSTTIYLGSTNVLVHADTTSDSQTSQATTSSSSSDTSSSSSQTSSSESSSATSASSTSEQTNSTTSSNSEASSSASSSESSTSSVSSSSSSSSSDSNENETNTSSNVVSTSSSSSADTNDSTTDQTSSSADGSSSSNQSLYTDEASATSAANKITEDNKTTTTTTTISTAYDNKSTASTQKSSFDFSQYSGLPEYYMWMSYINSNKDIKANASSNVVISDPVYDATTNTVTYTIHFNPSNGIVTTSGSTLTDASAQYAIEISKNLKVVSISYGYNGNMTDGTSTYTSGGGTLSSSSTNGTATKMIVSNTTYANTSTTGLSSSNAISSVSSDIGQTIIFSPNTTLYYQASNSKGLDVTIVATVDSSVSTSFTGVNAIESYIPKSLWNNNSGIRDMLGDTPVVMSTYKAVTSSTIAEGQAASNTTTTTMTNATGVASTSIPVSVVFDNSSSESNITSVDYTLTKSASSLKEANSTAYVNATDDSTSGSLSASNNYTQNYYDVEAIPSGTTVSSSALASDLLTSDALTVTDVKINSTSGTYSYLVSQTNSGIEIHVIDKTDLETAVNDQNDVQKTSAYYNASDDKKQAYDDAVAAGQTVLNNDSATQSEVDSATTAINSAKSALDGETTDKNALETAVNDQSDVQKTSAYYNASDDKKQAYDDAVSAGQTVLNDDSATQSEVDSATSAIDNAKSALDGQATDKTALETAVNDQNDVQKTSAYYNASDDKKQAYDDAVAAGQTVLNNDSATQSEVDSATSAINNAKSALDGQATDKTALETAVNEQSTVESTPAYYNASDDKKQAYDDAVSAGQKVLNNDSATQSEADSATTTINSAKAALDGETTDKRALETAVNDQSNVQKTSAYYNASDEKKQAYDDAVAAGQTVLNNDSATQSEVDSATTAINNAKSALDGETTDKSAWETAVNDQSDVQKTSAYYNASDDKKQAYDDAVSAGQTVLNNDSATQSEVDSATTAIDNAKAALDGQATETATSSTGTSDTTSSTTGSTTERSVEKSALETAVNEQSTVESTSAYYNASDDKKQAYNDAVSAGQTVLNDDSATQSEVDSATTAINNAKAALDGQATETDTSSTGASDTTSSTTGSTTENSVDKSGLEKAVNEQSTVESTDPYKNASDDKKQAYDDAVSAGQKVLNNDSATQSEVDSATTAINNAKSALDGQATDTSSTGASDTTSSTTGSTTENSVDKSGLETAVNEQSTVEATDAYKNASNDKKQAYDDAVSAGQKVLNNDSATQSEVDSATTAIDNAKAALDGQATETDTSSTGASDTTSSTPGTTTESSVDKSALETAVNEQSDVQKTSAYYNASDDKKQAYDDAVAAGQTVLNNDSATQSEVDSATSAIDNAKAALDGQSSSDKPATQSETDGSTESVDKTNLQKDVDRAHEVQTSTNPNEYLYYASASDEARKAYGDAVAKGEQVLSDTNATQEEVDAADKAIRDAEQRLIDSAEKAQNNVNLPERVKVEKMGQPTSDELSQIKKNIEAANPNTTVTVYSDGSATIKFSDGSSAELTKEDTTIQTDAIENNGDRSSSENTGNSNFENYDSSIDKSSLEAAVNEKSSVESTDAYKNASDDKKQAYDDAVSAGQKVLNDNSATQNEVDQALQTIKNAKAALDDNTEINSKATANSKSSSVSSTSSKEKTPASNSSENRVATDANKLPQTGAQVGEVSLIGLILALLGLLGFRRKKNNEE